MYYLNMGEYYIVGSSPEILVRLENNLITVRPIAGTRPRGKTEKEDDLTIGAHAITKSGKRGFIRYVGPLKKKPGLWVGLELHEPVGKPVGPHDGSLDGVRYFTCEPMYGIFVKQGSEHHCRVDREYRKDEMR